MTIALVAFGSALFGALVGGTTSFLLDVWRRALDGVMAARLVRLELSRNRAVLRGAIQRHVDTPPLSDAIWIEFAVNVAPILEEAPLSRLSRDMALVPVVQKMLDGMQPSDPGTAMIDYLGSWSRDLQDRANELFAAEQRSKRRHMVRIVFGGRPAIGAELTEAFGPDVAGTRT